MVRRSPLIESVNVTVMDTVTLELQSSVLVVEPDTTLAQRIALDLQEAGYEVANRP